MHGAIWIHSWLGTTKSKERRSPNRYGRSGDRPSLMHGPMPQAAVPDLKTALHIRHLEGRNRSICIPMARQKPTPLVAVIMGSSSDWETVRHAVDMLKDGLHAPEAATRSRGPRRLDRRTAHLIYWPTSDAARRIAVFRSLSPPRGAQLICRA